MPRSKREPLPDNIVIDMTPMIDIVFQLLTFFVMTFKIAEAEGDFNVKMPLAAPRAGLPDTNQLPPMKLRLKASPSGNLAEIALNERTFAGGGAWNNLRSHVAGIIGDDRGPGSLQSTAEVEIDADYNLKYEFIIRAITAVSGSPQQDGSVIKLVEKIKFTPPKNP